MSNPSASARSEDSTHESRDPLKGLETARREMHAAEELLEQARADLRQRLYEIGRSVPEPTRKAVLNEVYWRWTELNASDIAEAFGYESKELRRLIEPYYSEEHPCLDCGAPLLITSRNKMMEIERVYRARERGGRSYNWNARCERCEAVREHARDEEYAERSRLYAEQRHELATMPYREYLQTPEWQARRQRHLRSAGFRCQLCNTGARALHVHHRTYERRGDERWSDLLVLCADCHAKHHDRLRIVEE